MTKSVNRRIFLNTGLAGMGYWVTGGIASAQSRSSIEKINFASIGIEGAGKANTARANGAGNVVAICDIDDERLGKAAVLYPKANKYYDFRKMLEVLEREIDAVVISTPNHTHAVASVMAMNMRKHCLCEKPLTHTIYEGRRVAEIARKANVVTQMNNQHTASTEARNAAELIRTDIIGNIQDIHVWSNRPIWPQGMDYTRTQNTSAPPSSIHWNEWLGPAAFRPYSREYIPFRWRAWWAFGDGAIGDMAPHTMNLPYMALDLRNPIMIEATTPGHNRETYPKWSIIKYHFKATAKRGAINMTWYDGGKLPTATLFEGEKISPSGSLIIGDKGKLYSQDDYGTENVLLPKAYFRDFKEPKFSFPKSLGHFEEFVEAIQNNGATFSNFPDYAASLTELAHLGNLAIWAGRPITWDGENMKATNAPELESVIKSTYRPGYSI